MGIADLTGPRAKLWWANEHLRVFDEEFREFFAREPEAVVIKFRRKKGWHIMGIDPLPLPPMRLVLLAGDCLHNLRGALDHLVWQLIIREEQKLLRTHHFPLCETEQQFLNDVESPQTPEAVDQCPLQGLPVGGKVWTIIKEAQPFRRPDPQKSALFFLLRMNNVDKHRTLLIQQGVPDEKTITECVRWSPNFKLVGKKWIFTKPSQKGPTQIMRWHFSPKGDARMYVDGAFHVFPTLGDGITQMPFDIIGAACREVKNILEQVAALPRVKDIRPAVQASLQKRRQERARP